MHILTVWWAACLPHSSALFIHEYACRRKTSMLTKVLTHMFHRQRFKTKLFFFLFLVCLLQVIPKKKKKKLLALQITISIIFFVSLQACFSFASPFLPSILPSLPHYPVIVLSLVWERRGQARGGGGGGEEERKMANFLLVCVSVCASLFFFFFPGHGLMESGQSEPKSLW